MQDLLFLDHLADLRSLGTYPAMPGKRIAHLGESSQQGADHAEDEAAYCPLRGFFHLVERIGSLVYGVLCTIWGPCHNWVHNRLPLEKHLLNGEVVLRTRVPPGQMSLVTWDTGTACTNGWGPKLTGGATRVLNLGL